MKKCIIPFLYFFISTIAFADDGWLEKFSCLSIEDNKITTIQLMVSCDGYDWPGVDKYFVNTGYGAGCVVVTGDNTKITYELPSDAEDCDLAENRPNTLVFGKK